MIVGYQDWSDLLFLHWRVPVRHQPWPLFAAWVSELREDLSASAGMPSLGRPDSCQWSPGVSGVRALPAGVGLRMPVRIPS